ncbi:MAG: ATP-binding protein [Prevotellaceae bacterium]|jgi:predicted AAA+ superfamily ATPase|nr:ATP-binding protein [Prevotellaceae bacterium]
MVTREIESALTNLMQKYPAINITGPRQSGKTTLVKELLKEHRYFSLENPDIRLIAEEDPRGFLRSAGEKFILDEVQNVPQLFSYLQQEIDDGKANGSVILLGSQSFLINERISQSLAGRVANIKLLPLSYSELQSANLNFADINAAIFNGGYPRLYKEKMLPSEFYPFYIETYLQRDVRLLKHIGNLQHFNRFMKLCAGRAGNILNISSLANDAEISVNTAKSWLSVLEASYIIFLILPFSPNVNRRWVKMPKLYFYDTGLACALLNLENEAQIDTFYMKGNLFENFIFSELLKMRFNKGLPANFFFLRDSKGNEIDCIIEKAQENVFIEIKMSNTFSPAQLKNIQLFRNEEPAQNADYLIYTGEEELEFKNVKYRNWQNINRLNL